MTSNNATPPSWLEIVNIILPFIIIIIYDRFLSYRLSNKLQAPGTYEQDAYGDDVNSALLLEKMNIINKRELNWLLNTYKELKKKGLVKNIDEMLSESEQRIIAEYRKLKEE